ncbi:MAG: diol dehydratase reactivase ATPase-like domain-containing protein [Gemmatimonadota bacterium]
MTVVAGVDVGNATTEVVIASGGRILGAGRVPTRGRKGSAESLRGAAALVRRLERRLAVRVDEARVAPLRAVTTATVTVPELAPPAGRLRVAAAGATTPGGTGVCVGPPLWLGRPPVAGGAATGDAVTGAAVAGGAVAGGAVTGAAVGGGAVGGGAAGPVVAVVPASVGYAAAVARLRELRAAGVTVGAVLAGGDEGVLIANRIGVAVPVADQADTAALAGCELVAVEVQEPGKPLVLVADPVALGAALGLGEAEAGTVTAVCRTLLDYSNAVVGVVPAGTPLPPPADDGPWVLLRAPGLLADIPDGGLAADAGLAAGATGAGVAAGTGAGAGPGAEVGVGQRAGLRAVCGSLAGWPVGAVSALGADGAVTEVDDLFAVDLAAVAERATARRGGLGRAVLVASLTGLDHTADPAGQLASLLGCPARTVLTEPAAARLGAATTPGALADALVIDVGAGTIDVISPAGEVVAAGAGELLTWAVAEALGIPRAAADWVKRAPCVRVDGGQRFEAEDGSRGFLDRPAPPAATGMLAVAGPAGLLPFDRRHAPGEWRALRLRLKQAALAANLGRALRTLGATPRQVLVVGGPAGDDELVGVLSRSLPDGVAVGRGRVGGTLGGDPGTGPLGHRYAAALGLALAGEIAVPA